MASGADTQFLEHAEDMLADVQDCQSNAVPCALCIATNVSGGLAGSVGTLVAVRADGEMAGYVAHRCVDADLRLQAQAAIEAAQPRQLIYGVRFPFMDLQLPCGGSVEVLVDPAPDPEACAMALQHLQNRQPVALIFTGKAGLVSAQRQRAHTGWVGNIFSAWHPPALQLIVAGTGLQGNPCYVGASGSSHTHQHRLATLKALGMPDNDQAG